jgi:hypothetical protein
MEVIFTAYGRMARYDADAAAQLAALAPGGEEYRAVVGGAFEVAMGGKVIFMLPIYFVWITTNEICSDA